MWAYAQIFFSRNNHKNLWGEKLEQGKKRFHFLFYHFFVLFKCIIIVYTLLLYFFNGPFLVFLVLTLETNAVLKKSILS